MYSFFWGPIFFYDAFVREVKVEKKHVALFFSHDKNLFEGDFFPCRFFPLIAFIAFLAGSRHGELKNTIKVVSNTFSL
jgi:hypothetical protein